MDSEKEIEQLDVHELIAKAAEEFETKGKTQQRCPQCNGKLRYYRAGKSFRISCENEKQCGLWEGIRGL